MFAAIPGPSDTLKRNYSAAVRNAFIIAISIHVLIFAFFPPFEFRPYALDAPEEPIVLVKVPEFKIPPPPPEVSPPNIVVPIAGDKSGEDVKLSPTAPDEFPPAPVLKCGSKKRPNFVPFDVPPKLIKWEKPVYPALARQAGIEGRVVVKVVIDKAGKVIEASVLSSDVTPSMEKSALQAARKCRFKPAKQGSMTVKATVAIPFDFRLR